MAKLMQADSPDHYVFRCPGCDKRHVIDSRWDFNKDMDKPTFSPSYLLRGRFWTNGQWADIRCHSYIKNGRIQFLKDCTHSLAGTTVELPDLPG